VRSELGHGAELMGGLRYARNSVHHQRSDALRLDETGFAFPRTFPMVFFGWRWAPADQLPPPAKKPRAEDEATYREEMEGRPVRLSLDVLNGAFFALEPPTSPEMSSQSAPLFQGGPRGHSLGRAKTSEGGPLSVTILGGEPQLCGASPDGP
jgi:hypothetical protein